MAIRSRRRQLESSSLDSMSDADLSEIYFFGDLTTESGVRSFTATETEQARAAEILKARRKVAER